MPGSELGAWPGALGRTPPDAQEAGAARSLPLSPRDDANLQQKASLLFGHFRSNRKGTNKKLGRPLRVEARVCVFSPDLGSEPWPWGCRPRPSAFSARAAAARHKRAQCVLQTRCERREGPRACRPSPRTPAEPPHAGRAPTRRARPLCWRGASMPAACAAEAHPRPLPCVRQLSDGKSCSGREGRAQGLGPGEGGTPAPPGGPQAWGPRGLHRWRARPGQAAASPDSVIQHCSAPLISMISASRRRRAAAEQQPAAPGTAPPPGRLAAGPAGAPRPAERTAARVPACGAGGGLSPAAVYSPWAQRSY